MVQRFVNEHNNRKILFGNDTDVSDVIITKYHEDQFLVVSIMHDDERGTLHPTTYVLTRKQFTKDFELQYGSPMMFMSKEDFEWMIN